MKPKCRLPALLLFPGLLLWLAHADEATPLRDLEIRLLGMARDATPEESWAVAPHALSEVLFLMYAGSNNHTTEALHEHLFVDLPRETVHGHVQAMQRDRFGYRSYTGVWIDPAMDLLASFQAQVEEHWKAPLIQAPLLQDPQEAARNINTWFSEKTKGRFPHIFDAPPADKLHFLALNLAEFSGRWDGFDPQDTREMPFYQNENERVMVHMMRSRQHRNYFQDERFHALQLPFQGGTLAMLVLLPRDPQNFDPLLGHLTAQHVQIIHENLRQVELIVHLPKVKTKSHLNWGQILSTHELGDLFQHEAAPDFSRISGPASMPLFVGQLSQVVTVEWNERGAKAVAITALGGEPFGTVPTPPPPSHFIANHPFLFVIYDTQDLAILYAGTIREDSDFVPLQEAPPEDADTP